MAGYYASTRNGNDGNGGTSWLDAKKTLAAVVAVAPTGSDVFVEEGLYFGEGFNVPAKTLHFKAIGEVIVDGNGVVPVVYATATLSSLCFDGFTFRNGNAMMIRMLPSASPWVSFRNCSFAQIGAFYQAAALTYSCQHVRFRGCTFYGMSEWLGGGGATHVSNCFWNCIAINFLNFADFVVPASLGNNASTYSPFRSAYGFTTDHFPPPFRDASAGDFSLDPTGFTLNIINGVNDTIPFSEGGIELIATIAPGAYLSGTTFATAIQVALNAAGALTYTVTYSAITELLTFAATGVFELLAQTGTGATHEKMVLLLGLDRIDYAGATTYTGRWPVGSYAVYMRGGNDFERIGASGGASVVFSTEYTGSSRLDDNVYWGACDNDDVYYDPAWPVGGLVIGALNDWIDFNEGGPEISVQVAHGTYVDGVALMAVVQNAINPAAAANITTPWLPAECRAQMNSDGATFNLLWNTGTHVATSIGATIGYDVTADDTGALSYKADYAITETRVNGAPGLKAPVLFSAGVATVDKNIEPLSKSARFYTKVLDMLTARDFRGASWGGTEGAVAGSWIDNSPGTVSRELEVRGDPLTFAEDAVPASTNTDWTMFRRDKPPVPTINEQFYQLRCELREDATEP